jgi:hypothetical protein
MTIKHILQVKKSIERASTNDSNHSKLSITWYNNILERCKECLKGISSKSSKVRYLQDVIVLLIWIGLLYYGSFWQMFRTDVDAAHYQCYAVAFWQGLSGLEHLPHGQCAFIVYPDKYLVDISQNGLINAIRPWNSSYSLINFITAQSSLQPYHMLPYEYPWLMLLPFSIGLVVPAHWYQIAFAIEMLVIAGCVYIVLQRWRSRRAALVYALYLLVGAWSTVASRFDIIPGALVLFAVICAKKKRWNWAFACLALATLTKFYPAILFVPFLLALQQETLGKWYVWRRWLPMGVFVCICVCVMSVSLLLNVVGTLTPLSYFSNRPVQIESLSASLLWVFSLLGRTSLTYAFTFGSINVFSPLAANISFRMIVMLFVSLVYTWWLQWRGRIDLAMACLLTLLIVMVTGKIFSVQYLIWVIPLAAYVGQNNRWWLLFWSIVGLLTSWIYPSIYMMDPVHLNVRLLYPVVAVRNFLLVGFILVLLISRSSLDHQLSHEQAESDELMLAKDVEEAH